MTITQQDIDNDQRIAKQCDLEVFFERFEEYIKAVIIDTTSIHVEDSVRLTELRKAFIESILDKEFNLHV